MHLRADADIQRLEPRIQAAQQEAKRGCSRSAAGCEVTVGWGGCQNGKEGQQWEWRGGYVLRQTASTRPCHAMPRRAVQCRLPMPCRAPVSRVAMTLAWLWHSTSSSAK